MKGGLARIQRTSRCVPVHGSVLPSCDLMTYNSVCMNDVGRYYVTTACVCVEDQEAVRQKNMFFNYCTDSTKDAGMQVSSEVSDFR